MRQRLRFVIYGMSFSTLLLLNQLTFASAFQIWEQGETDLGDVHAGAAAWAFDATTEFYNPAGMTELSHPEISGGLTDIETNFTFKGSTQIQIDPTHPNFISNLVGGVFSPETGNPNTGRSNLAPNFHYVQPLGSRFAVGLGVTVPFGLQTDWGADTMVADTATTTSLRVININPNVAFKVSDNFSIAAGLDVQNGFGEFDQFILGDAVTNKMNGWGYGWNAGALYKVSAATRFGISYRSQVNHNISGSSTAREIGLDTGRLLGTAGSTVTTNIPTPSTTMFSIFQALSQRWDAMFSTMYTNWSIIKNFTLSNVTILPTGATANITLPQDYHDTWNFALGANYHMSKTWLMEMGIGFDQSPVRNNYRDVRLPDSNHYTVGLGTVYIPNDNFMLALGYNHVFTAQSSVNNQIPTGLPGVDVHLLGNIDGGADVIGAQITWTFA